MPDSRVAAENKTDTIPAFVDLLLGETSNKQNDKCVADCRRTANRLMGGNDGEGALGSAVSDGVSEEGLVGPDLKM